MFRIGEKLTYNVGFEKFSNVAFLEIAAVSRGRLGASEAVEVRVKAKTLDFVAAAFYLVDENRTVFATPDTALPLYVVETQNIGGLPKESVRSYLTNPAPTHDLVTLLYRLRNSEGNGMLTFSENDKFYQVSFQTTGAERMKTDAGEFDTTVQTLQSEYFNELGLKDFRINWGTDGNRVPIAMRFRTAKGEFRAKLASIQIDEPAQPVPVPTLAPLVRPTPVLVPTATPKPYIENIPVSPELSFTIGEILEYKVMSPNSPPFSFALHVVERKMIDGRDALHLRAYVLDASPGALFAPGDHISAIVNPETLGPRKLDVKVTGTLSSMSGIVTFDDKTNMISAKGVNVEAPVGTHSILSLIYALRSFNLKPSKDLSNPINDTRVAVFWETKPHIFSLRPSEAEVITLNGVKVSAQPISITTGIPQLDGLGLRVWLSNDEKRVPLKFNVGAFQAELSSNRIVPVQ